MKDPIESLFRQSRDPDLAERQWRDLLPLCPPSVQKAPHWNRLLSLLGNSDFMPQFLIHHPKIIRQTIESPFLLRPKGKKEMLSDLNRIPAASSQSSPDKILREYRKAELIRIAVRDLSQTAPFEEIGEELSSLAEAILETGLSYTLRKVFHRRKIPPWTVIGLGKLGGRDLNFSSDVDLIYLYDVSEERTSVEERRDLFELSAKTAEKLTRLVDEKTEDGFAYRVDLNLRPEGKNGPLANSLDALLTYYEVSGSQWERAALTRAWASAGDKGLGQRFLCEVEPFVYPRATDLAAIAALREMKEKIRREITRGGRRSGYNVKLGSGGIREIEFFATAFQLTYGGREKKLREVNTLRLLGLLGELGLVPKKETERLREAYIFLRRIENRLQMIEDRQVHSLPQDRHQLRGIARMMGFDSSESFLKDLEDRTRYVSSRFAGLAS